MVNNVPESIIVAIIAFAGTALGSFSGLKLTSYRVQQLEKKVDKHNNFAARMPVVEEQIKVMNHRIDDLERKEENEHH